MDSFEILPDLLHVVYLLNNYITFNINMLILLYVKNDKKNITSIINKYYFITSYLSKKENKSQPFQADFYVLLFII